MTLGGIGALLLALVIVFAVAGLAMVKLPEFKAAIDKLSAKKEVK